MAHNIDSMAYYGEPPWHGLGTKVPARANAETMIKAAGLDWIVEKQPVHGAKRDEDDNPLRYQLVRKARNEKEHDTILGLVSPIYEPLQNREAFNFFDNIVEGGSAIFETAGALGDGERVWVLAKLPGEIRVIGNDIVNKYLLLSNNHAGKESVIIKFTPIRVVCQNTLMIAMKDGEKAVKIRHTKNISKRLAEVPDILGISKELYEHAREIFQTLARVRMKENRLNEYLEALFPRTKKQIEERKYPEKWGNIKELFEIGDRELNDGRGSLWAAYNAVVRFEDYRTTKEAGPDRRLNRTWFGSGADLKMKALEVAKELSKSWN